MAGNESVGMEEFLGVNYSGMFYPYCNVCDASGAPSSSYKTYNMIMTGILLPTVGLFGIMGNCVSAYVYTRPSMLSSLNLYLCALAVSDICVITTAFFLFFMEGMRRYDPTIAYIFGAGAPVFFPSGLTAQTCSVYFTLAAAIDCFLQVCAPARMSKRACTKRRALVVIPIIALLAAAYNITHCFEVAVVECWDAKFSTLSLQVCMTPFRMDPLYLEIYYVYLYTIVMAVGPLVVLVLLNAIIIGALALKSRRSKGVEPGEEEESVDAVTLILVVFLFIFCNSLALVINFLEQTYFEQLGEALNYLVDVSNLFVVCNSSANIIFYYFFGESFRRTLNAMCRRRRLGQAVDGHTDQPLTNGKVSGNGYLPVSSSPPQVHKTPGSPEEDPDGLSASIGLYAEDYGQYIDPQDVDVQTHRV